MQVSLEILQLLSGTSLKVFILVSNSDAMTAEQIAAMLKAPIRSVFRALAELQQMALVVKNGTFYCQNGTECQNVKEKERSKEKRNFINTSTTTSTIDAREDFEEKGRNTLPRPTGESTESPFRRRPVVFGRNDAARCSFRSKPQTEWLLHPLSGDTSAHILGGEFMGRSSVPNVGGELTGSGCDPFSWLTDDEETMTALVMNNRLPADQTPLETLRPYIETFLDREKAKGTDFYLKGRTDTKKHFANWLPKYLIIKNNGFDKLTINGYDKLTINGSGEPTTSKQNNLFINSKNSIYYDTRNFTNPGFADDASQQQFHIGFANDASKRLCSAGNFRQQREQQRVADAARAVAAGISAAREGRIFA